MSSVTWDRHRGYSRSYDVDDVGFNFRMDEPRAALGMSRLPRLAGEIDRRREVVRGYRDRLAGQAGVELVFDDAAVEPASHFAFPVLAADRAARDRARDGLAERGIQTTWYPAVHRFSGYAERRRAATHRRARRAPLLPPAVAHPGGRGPRRHRRGGGGGARVRALVTGCAGFIGSHVADALRGTRRRGDRSGPAARAEHVQADLAEAELEPLLDGVDVVFHLAGPARRALRLGRALPALPAQQPARHPAPAGGGARPRRAAHRVRLVVLRLRRGRRARLPLRPDEAGRRAAVPHLPLRPRRGHAGCCATSRSSGRGRGPTWRSCASCRPRSTTRRSRSSATGARRGTSPTWRTRWPRRWRRRTSSPTTPSCRSTSAAARRRR